MLGLGRGSRAKQDHNYSMKDYYQERLGHGRRRERSSMRPKSQARTQMADPNHASESSDTDEAIPDATAGSAHHAGNKRAAPQVKQVGISNRQLHYQSLTRL